MRFYFGNVPSEDIEMFGDDGLYEHNGEHYYYMAEYGSNPGGFEDVTISDGCGRSIPIGIDVVDQLTAILNECSVINSEINAAEELEQNTSDPHIIATVDNDGNIDY